jgi:hypothetical protein
MNSSSLRWAPIRMKVALLCVIFAAGVSNAQAQRTEASCGAVLQSLALLRKQLWVQVRGQVLQGVHPEGYKEMTSSLQSGKRQIRVLDGTRFSSNHLISNQEELDQVTAAADLTPDSECIRVEPDDTKREAHIEFTYSTKVARAEAYFRISISPSSGLPVKVRVNGPQLVYGRSLSRPGKPPQVVLKTNGLRYTEVLDYTYNEASAPRLIAPPTS